MKVLGIDPGSRATGFGLVAEEGGRLTCLACGVVRANGTLPVRLRRIFEGLGGVIAAQGPGEVAVEEVFLSRNFQSALALGEARGAALLAAATAGLEVFEYSASEVKKAVAGYGRADKLQVQAMVCRLLGLVGAAPLASDASDALAVAICHLNSRRICALTRACAGPPR